MCARGYPALRCRNGVTGRRREKTKQGELGCGETAAPRAVGRPELGQGLPGAIVIDQHRAHVRRTRDCRGVAELAADGPHHGGKLARCIRVRARRAAPFELDGREQRAAPRAEVLCREPVTECLREVHVEKRRREVDELAVTLEPEEARPVGQSEQLVDALRKRGILDRPSNELSVLRAEHERDLVSGDRHVPFRERRHAVRPGAFRMLLGPDAKPCLVDEADRERARPFALVGIEPQMPFALSAQARQPLREVEQTLELRPLLGRPVGRVVEVLLPARRVDARRLQARVGIGRDPHILPGGWDREVADALEVTLVRDLGAVRVHVSEPPTALPPPSTPSGHARPLPARTLF